MSVHGRRTSSRIRRAMASTEPGSRYSSTWRIGVLLGRHQFSDLSQRLERLTGRLFVDARDREANVDEHIVTYPRLRKIGEAHTSHDAGKVDSSHPEVGIAADLQDASGYR